MLFVKYCWSADVNVVLQCLYADKQSEWGENVKINKSIGEQFNSYSIVIFVMKIN